MRIERLCLTKAHWAHGRPTLAQLQSEDCDYYGSPGLCEDLRREHARRSWQAICAIFSVVHAFRHGQGYPVGLWTTAGHPPEPWRLP